MGELLDQKIYAPPQADLGVATPRNSPRLRFWLASLSGMLSAPVLLYALVGLQAPIPVFPIAALAAWLGPLLWILSSHRQLTGHITIGRFVVVAAGLALAMSMFAILGIGIATVLMVNPGLD